MTILTVLLILVAVVVSYFFADPAIVWMLQEAHPRLKVLLLWIEWGGNHRREIAVVLGIVWVVMGIIQLWLLREKRTKNWLWVVVVVTLLVSFAYPFLSSDLFNYMFDAKIFTFYHQNPYLQRALDYPSDQWTRFMHWTHRTYPYGPIFLLLSFIPSFLGFGKFTPTFLLFKAMFVGFYLLAVFFLNKLDKKWAIIFATHPLILIEGLISSHNDLIALCLAVIGIFFPSRSFCV